MPNLSLSEKLSEWLHQTRARGMPPAVLEVAKTYVLDWFGCALAGTATEPGAKLLAYAQDQPNGPCPLIGTDRGGTPEVAALVNGGLSHIVEMDDLDRGSITHPAAVVIPAALAIATYCGASGADFLSAVVAGYEVAIRIGEQVGKRHYYFFHNTSTCGVFGAAAAASWLLGLNDVQTTYALGNAGTLAAGLWEFNTEGAMSKHLHAGRAAANGVLAGLLARQGFTGARRILEGPRGFFAALAPDADPRKVVTGLRASQEVYKLESVSIKPYASCRHTHPAIDAALALRPQINGQPIEDIHVEIYRAALDLCDNPRPRTPYEAKFSLQYSVASALIRGRAGLDEFLPQAISDLEMTALLPKITLRHEDALEASYPAQWPAAVVVTLESGERIRAEIEIPKGDPENALSSGEVQTKYFQMAEYAGRNTQAAALAKWVEGLPQASETELTGLLQ